MIDQNITIDIGIAGSDKLRAAELYEEAFGAKLGVAISSQEHRVNLLRDGMRQIQTITQQVNTMLLR